MEDKKTNQEVENISEEVKVEEAQNTAQNQEEDSVEISEKNEEVTEKPQPTKKTSKKKEKVKKEKVEESYDGLSDDEIYTKMQTEKLLKRKKQKRIITSVAMGVAFAIAVVIIVLATVPVSLKPRCISNDYTMVRLYDGTSLGSSNAAFGAEDEGDRFERFQEVFDDSFGQSYLTALFSGSLSASYYEPQEVPRQSFQAAMNDLISNNIRFVQLSYSEEKTLTYQNGEVYISPFASATFDGVFTFTDVYIELNSEEGFRETRVIIPVTYPSDEQENTYAITITIRANTYKVYEAWGDFVDE